jgi:hypothetical protein
MNRIPQDNLEIIDQRDIENKLPKLQILQYNPALFYWDVDNIEFQLISY